MHIFLIVITLILTLTNDGLRITVSSDTPTHVYVQVDNAEPAIRLCDLGAGESCGFTAHGAGAVRVRVWDGATDPIADQTVTLPALTPLRIYLPIA